MGEQNSNTFNKEYWLCQGIQSQHSHFTAQNVPGAVVMWHDSHTTPDDSDHMTKCIVFNSCCSFIYAFSHPFSCGICPIR